MRIKCSKCGYEKFVSDLWFDPPDLSDIDGEWEQDFVCPKCKAKNAVKCEYHIEFDVVSIGVEE